MLFSLFFTQILVYAISEWYNLNILSNKDNQSISFVSGTVRQQINGEWFAQNDEGHTSLNISSVGIVGNKIRINYQSQVSKVISLVITPDDTLAKKGYIVSGSSVGLGAADFEVGRMLNVYGGISYVPSTNSWYLGYQNSNEYKITLEQMDNGVLRVWHKEDDFGLIPTQLTARDGGYNPKLFLFSNDYFDVKFYNNTGNLVTVFDSKCTFLFSRAGYRMVDVTKEKFPIDGNFWVIGIMEN